MELSDGLIEGVFDAGEDDWVQFIDLGHLLIEESGKNDDLIQRGVNVAAELIERGILQPGMPTKEGFQPWTCSRTEAIERIRKEAHAISEHRRIFQPGDICWFETQS